MKTSTVLFLASAVFARQECTNVPELIPVWPALFQCNAECKDYTGFAKYCVLSSFNGKHYCECTGFNKKLQQTKCPEGWGSCGKGGCYNAEILDCVDGEIVVKQSLFSHQ